MTHLLVLGLLQALAGCTAFYLSSPQQRWLSGPWPRLPARAAGVCLLLGSAWAYGRCLQPLTAVFVLVSTCLLGLMLPPHVGVLLSLRRGPR